MVLTVCRPPFAHGTREEWGTRFFGCATDEARAYGAISVLPTLRAQTARRMGHPHEPCAAVPFL